MSVKKKAKGEYPFIIIDDYKFTLEGKILHNRYWHVYVTSQNVETLEITNFWVYPSNSELGLWRLSAASDGIKYKGEFISEEVRRSRPPGDYFYYDYVQQTFIHIELQIFINDHFNNLKIKEFPIKLTTPNKPFETPSLLTKENNDKIFDVIDDHDRQLRIEPFSTLQNIIECGEVKTITPRRRTPDVVIKEFSTLLEREYILHYDGIEIIAPYNKIFQDMINITGSIMKFPLINIYDDRVVMLYACIIKMSETENRGSFRNSAMNITRICGKDLHIMPFFLTTEDSSINEFGVYTKYIPCGAFVCKLFDYSDGYHRIGGYIQCTRDEFDNNHCTDTYSYVGDRFDNIFPFNKWIEQTNLLNRQGTKKRKSGINSASPKSPKRTRRRTDSF